MWFVPRDGTGRPMPGIRPSDGAWLVSLGWAAAFVALAALTRAAFEFLAPGLPAYPTFLVAVLFAALQQGAAAGLFAMVPGAIGGAYFLMSPLPTPAQWTAASALYFASSLLVIWGTEHFRRRTERSTLEEQQRDRHEHLIVNQNENVGADRRRRPAQRGVRQARPHHRGIFRARHAGLHPTARPGRHPSTPGRGAQPAAGITTTRSTAARSDRRPVHAARRRTARRPSSSPTSSMTRFGPTTAISHCPTIFAHAGRRPSCRVRRVCSAHSPSTTASRAVPRRTTSTSSPM